MTAYDESSADGDISAIAPINQGQAARTTDKSENKITETSGNTNTSGEKVEENAAPKNEGTGKQPDRKGSRRKEANRM